VISKLTDAARRSIQQELAKADPYSGPIGLFWLASRPLAIEIWLVRRVVVRGWLFRSYGVARLDEAEGTPTNPDLGAIRLPASSKGRRIRNRHRSVCLAPQGQRSLLV